MKIAFIGDVVGRSGRRALARAFPEFKTRESIDFAIANLENAAGGFGITQKAVRELEKADVDFFTSGNHIWDKREGVALLDDHPRIVRPANYPGRAPGYGSRTVHVGNIAIAILNVQGRVFMPAIDCPFRAAERLLSDLDDSCHIRIVDMHAEATSEKIAMGWFLDGKVTAVLGTHTHVPTRDARLLPGGTAYVTDVGMTGAYESVLGVDKGIIIERFLNMRPARFEIARNDLRSDLVVLDVDETTGKARSIDHLQLRVED